MNRHDHYFFTKTFFPVATYCSWHLQLLLSQCWVCSINTVLSALGLLSLLSPFLFSQMWGWCLLCYCGTWQFYWALHPDTRRVKVLSPSHGLGIIKFLVKAKSSWTVFGDASLDSVWTVWRALVQCAVRHCARHSGLWDNILAWVTIWSCWDICFGVKLLETFVYQVGCKHRMPLYVSFERVVRNSVGHALWFVKFNMRNICKSNIATL